MIFWKLLFLICCFVAFIIFNEYVATVKTHGFTQGVGSIGMIDHISAVVFYFATIGIFGLGYKIRMLNVYFWVAIFLLSIVFHLCMYGRSLGYMVWELYENGIDYSMIMITLLVFTLTLLAAVLCVGLYKYILFLNRTGGKKPSGA